MKKNHRYNGQSLKTRRYFNEKYEQMVRIGEATRQSVHTQGLWHQTFHCWIVSKSSKGELNLLFQYTPQR
jgi:hypothetical protein